MIHYQILYHRSHYTPELLQTISKFEIRSARAVRNTFSGTRFHLPCYSMSFVPSPFTSFSRSWDFRSTYRVNRRLSSRRLSNGKQPHHLFARALLDTGSENPSSSPTVSLVSLGCPKNVTDAEVMLGDLSSQGVDIKSSDFASDVIIINTCGFVEDAKRESLDAILSAAKEKRTGKTKGVIVTGCLAQRYADVLAEELPEVDAVVGFEHYDEIANRVKHLASASRPAINSISATSDGVFNRVSVGSSTVPFRPEHERFRLGPQHTVYVRLAEGCSHQCTFCAIPGQFRGTFRSKSWSVISSEIDHLASKGAVELVFVAEDTNQYGTDFGNTDPRRLSDLLHYVAKQVNQVRWVRLLYCYPSYFTDELIDAIAKLDIVCKYIDIPLQHISDNVLRRMNRPGRSHTEALLQKLRHRIPNLTLRSTFITGFPGETEEDHRQLVEFIKNSRFDHAGFFVYSEEEGTPAASFDNQVPMDVRLNRKDELTSIQQKIQKELAAEKIGQTLEVIIDKIEEGHSIGRTRGDAPEIDAQVHILQQIEPGTILPVRILGTSLFDLYAEPA